MFFFTCSLGVQADGQYQSSGFRRAFEERCPSYQTSEDTFNSICWDSSHWLNLAIVKVKDKSSCAGTLKLFRSRVNCFASMFGQGRGVAEFRAVSEIQKGTFRVVSFFSTIRYVMSNFVIKKNMYKFLKYTL